MLSLGVTEAIRYGLGAVVTVVVICALLWAYRAAREAGRLKAERKGDKEREKVFNELSDNLTTGKPHGSDGFRVRRPGKWPGKF